MRAGTRASPQRVTVAPPSMQQLQLLEFSEAGHIPEAFHQTWMMRRAILVRPGLRVDRLRRAVEKVVARHESLRMRFVYERNTWSVIVDSVNTNSFVEEDIGPIEEGDLQRVVADRLAPLLDPLTGPLLEVRLLRCGEQGDVLLLRGHHLILDAWSMALVLGDVIRSYVGIPLGRPSAMNHERFLREFTGHGKPALLAERETYFRKLLLPAPPLPKLGRASKGLEPNLNDVAVGPGAECTIGASLESRKQLLKRAKGAAVTENALFLAAYAKALGQFGDVDDVQINIAVANRTDRALHDYVGWANAMMPIRCKLRPGVGVEELARDLYAQYLRSAAHLPIDFAYQNRSGSLRQEQIEAGAFPKQFEGGPLAPEGMYKSVPLASTLFGSGNSSIKLMGIEIGSFPLDSISYDVINELELRTDGTGDQYKFIAIYDETAFDRPEIEDLVHMVIKNMGMEPEPRKETPRSKK